VKPGWGAYTEGQKEPSHAQTSRRHVQAAVKKRAAISEATKAKPKTEEAAPPKPRIAKKR